MKKWSVDKVAEILVVEDEVDRLDAISQLLKGLAPHSRSLSTRAGHIVHITKDATVIIRLVSDFDEAEEIIAKSKNLLAIFTDINLEIKWRRENDPDRNGKNLAGQALARHPGVLVRLISDAEMTAALFIGRSEQTIKAQEKFQREESIKPPDKEPDIVSIGKELKEIRAHLAKILKDSGALLAPSTQDVPLKRAIALFHNQKEPKLDPNRIPDDQEIRRRMAEINAAQSKPRLPQKPKKPPSDLARFHDRKGDYSDVIPCRAVKCDLH